MKKLLLLLSILLFVSFFLAPLSFARAASVLDPACNSTPEASICKDRKTEDVSANSIYGPNGILTKVASILSIIVGVVCVIAIIIGGLRYILSGGDSQQTANAKNAILYAIVGLVITITARAILVFVLGRIK